MNSIPTVEWKIDDGELIVSDEWGHVSDERESGERNLVGPIGPDSLGWFSLRMGEAHNVLYQIRINFFT